MNTERRVIAIVVLLASVFVMALGAQVYVAQRDASARDDRAAAQRISDQAYAECLTRFGNELVTGLRTLTRVNRRLEQATAAKSDTLDALLVITELGRRNPPKATGTQFDNALKARIDAQKNYDRVEAEVNDVRDDTPLEKPQAVCAR